MSFILGVDTGGTYTDAVILENEERIIAFSKECGLSKQTIYRALAGKNISTL